MLLKYDIVCRSYANVYRGLFFLRTGCVHCVSKMLPVLIFYNLRSLKLVWLDSNFSAHSILKWKIMRALRKLRVSGYIMCQ